eukprot:6202287-Pleurochrysis_carterae.AAC.1
MWTRITAPARRVGREQKACTAANDDVHQPCTGARIRRRRAHPQARRLLAMHARPVSQDALKSCVHLRPAIATTR